MREICRKGTAFPLISGHSPLSYFLLSLILKNIRATAIHIFRPNQQQNIPVQLTFSFSLIA